MPSIASTSSAATAGEASGSRNGDDIKFLCGKTRTEYKKETFERSAAEANEQLRTEGTVVAGSSNTAVERSAAAGEDHDQDDKRK